MHFLLQYLLGLILWQLQSVEACVGYWQSVLVLPVWFLNHEWEIVVVYRYLGGSCYELKEFVHLLLVELGYDLPEPFYHLGRLGVSLLVSSLGLQFHIYIISYITVIYLLSLYFLYHLQRIEYCCISLIHYTVETCTNLSHLPFTTN